MENKIDPRLEGKIEVGESSGRFFEVLTNGQVVETDEGIVFTSGDFKTRPLPAQKAQELRLRLCAPPIYKKPLIVALCEGRHQIDGVSKSIYPSKVKVTDIGELKNKAIDFVARKMIAQGIYTELNVYVTGVTTGLIEVVNACRLYNVDLVLFHYDRDSGTYFPQRVRG